MRVKVLINPGAARSSSVEWRSSLTKFFPGAHFDAVETQSMEGLKEAVGSISSKEFDALVAIGGDGTTHGAIQVMGDNAPPLMPYPAGTSNDLANELGIKKALKKTTVNPVLKKHKIDLIDINGTKMMSNGGIGLAADVAVITSFLRRHVPPYNWLLAWLGPKCPSAILSILMLKPWLTKVKLFIESEEFTGYVKTPFFMINNQPILAGNFILAPDTKNDDGTFSVVFTKHRSRFGLIRAVSKIAAGLFPKNDPDLVFFETNHIKIKNMKISKIPFMADGEIIEWGQEFEVKIDPQALPVLTLQ